jgi:hypothetical protein
MDTTEYKLIDISYTPEDLKKIEEYNKQHTEKALELFKYNRNNLLENQKNLVNDNDMKNRVINIQKNPLFSDFCKQYPIVSKYIIAFGLFSKKAFIKYLDWKAKVRPSDMLRAKLTNNQREQEKFKNKYIYAVYIKYLYQEKSNHKNLSDINNAYKLTYEDLNKETDDFFDLYDEEVKRQEEKKDINTEEKKQKILNQLKMKLDKQ